jgi:hypothetical protein
MFIEANWHQTAGNPPAIRRDETPFLCNFGPTAEQPPLVDGCLSALQEE